MKSNDDNYLKVFKDRSEYHDGETKDVFREGVISDNTKKRIKKSKDRTSEPNCNALDLPFFFNIEEKIGINAAENAPSANNRLKKFGSLKATKKTSAIKLAPTNAAIKISLKKPKILLINVRPLIVKKGFINFI